MHTPSFVELNQLQGAHYTILAGALRNILNTDIALTIYAQIIDGLPTADVIIQSTITKPLCDGVLEKAKEFRANFAMGDVKVDLEKVDRYKKTDPSSRSFGLRLIEMTACALHQIGVLLSRVEKLHDSSTTNGYDIEGTTKWERPPRPYPHGIDDIVGYWAENRILGGVALVDRSQSWEADDEPNVYFICTRANVTFRVCQLSDDQQSALLAFLLADSEDASALYPLPILPGPQNRQRIDPSEAIPIHKVHRDEWERNPPQPKLRMQRLLRSRAKNSLDYPEMDVDEEIERLNRM
ncbi:hypothetical protein BKA59DRAFT_513043 [Fusarium tricinctum]|uniref:Uncharacterized protein n=1 Tax=Fusarium tricinctum TaxID=61284 RepID=A0A8K0RTI3_9HYPO|nr:hypothetical protein BKA59DRAFT_513043 [Fusarium tricinctum]